MLMKSWVMSRFDVLLHAAATLQNLLAASFGHSVAGSWKIDRESYFLMIFSNRFGPRCKATVEIPNLDLIPLWSLDISLWYKLLRQRSRYKGDPKTYQECNISPPPLHDQHILMLNITTPVFLGRSRGWQTSKELQFGFRPWKHLWGSRHHQHWLPVGGIQIFLITIDLTIYFYFPWVSDY